MDWFLHDNGLRHETVKDVNYSRKSLVLDIWLGPGCASASTS